MENKGYYNNKILFNIRVPEAIRKRWDTIIKELIKKNNNINISFILRHAIIKLMDYLEHRNKDKFQTISLKKLRENEDNLTDKDYSMWDFMVTANIESMTYKNGEEDSICIRLNSIIFRDKGK